MIVPLFLNLLMAGLPQARAPSLDAADSLLARGELSEAKEIVSDYLSSHDDDYDALMLLGRIHIEWPVVGRFEAWRTFREASEIRPDSPAPYFWQALVGERLGGADGERMIREALLRVWELDPEYPYTWDLWQNIYHGRNQSLEAASVLEAHAGNAVADFRRVRMLIEAESYAQADSLIVEMQRGGNNSAAVSALAAESAFMQGQTARGADAYALALDDVESDTAGYLWEQIEAIASPEEIATHGGTESPIAMAAFYRAFWEKREPDLTTEINERIGEHFVRLRDARKLYRVRHPQSLYHRSARWRSIAGSNISRVSAATNQFVRPGNRPLDAQRQSGVADPEWDIGVREPDSLSRYRRYGLDGRGLILLRYGEPRSRLVSSGSVALGDVESWVYEIDGEDRVLTFARASGFGGFGGEMVFFPTDRVEVHNSEIMLERDETAIHPDIRMTAWLAFFRNPAGDGAFVYVRSHPDRSVVRVWDAGWRAVATVRGEGPLSLAAAPGRNTIGIDFRDGDRLARLREELTVPRFVDGDLAVSSVLVAAGDRSTMGRDEIAGLMPARLAYETDSSITLYAEVYGLAENGRGSVRYLASYTFIPEGRGTPVNFSFEKTVPASDLVEERLVVQPGRVGPGVYRVVFLVRDLTTDREVVLTRVDVRLR